MLVAGEFTVLEDGSAKYAPVRLNSNGSLDPTFEAAARGTILGVQPTGRILVGVFETWAALGGSGFRLSIDRMLPDGRMDPDFKRYQSSGPGSLPIIGQALQMDGKILILDPAASPALVRLNLDGSVDTGFHPAIDLPVTSPMLVVPEVAGTILWGRMLDREVEGGDDRLEVLRLGAGGDLTSRFTVNIRAPGGASAGVGVMVAAPDGRILIGGNFSHVGGIARRTVARLNNDGTVDRSFNSTDGVGVQQAVEVNALAPQADGGVLISFRWDEKGDGWFLYGVIRLTSAGSVDREFEKRMTGGPLISRDSWIANVAIEPSGQILLGGRLWASNSNPSCIVRLGSDGTLDEGFRSTIGIEHVGVSAAAQQPGGKVIVAGRFQEVNGFAREGLARLNSDGTLDPTFQPSSAGMISAVGMMPDGKVVVGGWPSGMQGMVKLNQDGTLDQGFARVDVRVWDKFRIFVQSEGKMVIGSGFDRVNGIPRTGLARLNQDGTLDAGYNPEFRSSGISNYSLDSFAERQDDRLLIGGNFETVNGVARSRIVQLTKDGAVDLSLRIQLPQNFVRPIVAAQSDGKILVAGFYNGVGKSALLRFNGDGSQDNQFSVEFEGGDNGNAEVWRVLAGSAGRIFVGGMFYRVNGHERRGFAWLNQDGTLGDSLDIGSSHQGTGAYVSMINELQNGDLLINRRFDYQGIVASLARLRPTPVIRNTRFADGQLTLSIGGEASWSYRVETSHDLENWTTSTGVAGTDLLTTFTDAAGDAHRRFYRVSRSAEPVP